MGPMADKRRVTDDTTAQRDRFVEAARAAECDDDPMAFRERLRAIGRQEPKPVSPTPPDKKPKP